MADNEQQLEQAETELDVVDLKIDLRRMTFDDLEAISSGGVAQALPILRRVVVGGIGHLPITEMPRIMAAMQRAFEELSNPKN